MCLSLCLSVCLCVFVSVCMSVNSSSIRKKSITLGNKDFGAWDILTDSSYLGSPHTQMNNHLAESGQIFLQIVKAPTTTSIQLNTTTIEVGFDTIMTVHTPPHHPPPRNSTPALVRLQSRINQPNLIQSS